MLIGLRSRNNYISDDDVIEGRREGKSQARHTIHYRHQPPLFQGRTAAILIADA